MKVLFVNAADTSRHVSSANAAIYPNLGLLTLMSAVEAARFSPSIDLEHLDGTVCGNAAINAYIRENYEEISVICFSALTANYGASIELAKLAIRLNPKITTIFGNDHFSALYERIMHVQACVSFGFHGSDVVEGFVAFLRDLLKANLKPLEHYSGLVYRTADGEVRRNSENPAEFQRLPLVNYALADNTFSHNEKYAAGQTKTYFFMRDRGLRSQVVDIGRGCIKFAGPRTLDVPDNACDFCGIIPGGKPIIFGNAERSWRILENAYRQGYNYFYITADELPLTFWGLLRAMAKSKPDWFESLPSGDRPRMFGYARAEGFATDPEKIDTIVGDLGFDHFFIGFDGLSEVSLRVMNKGPVSRGTHNLLEHNLRALESVVARGCLVTAGIVVTHLGITPEILKENFRLLEEVVSRHPSAFAALDFGPLCPIPGSQSFRYFTHPDFAEKKARDHGLNINRPFLDSVRRKYLETDSFDMDELVSDFVTGCCPDISMAMVNEYLGRTRELAERHSIVVGGGV